MEFLESVLGIHVEYMGNDISSIPNYINARYRLQTASLDGQQVVLVYPKADLESIDAVRKHLDRIRIATGAPTILMADHLTYRQREYLLRDHTPFVVEGRQIYLPFMAVYLQERCDAERPGIVSILPSAQLLLLYYIYHGCGELLTSDAAEALGYTATSISRASRQLAELRLVQTRRCGVQKVLYSDQTPRELFDAAQAHLTTPVKRTIYVPLAAVEGELLVSGYSALSAYSMINPPSIEYYAAETISAWERHASDRLQYSDDQCAVELWRYDPRRLADGECVDRLSLALALRGERDERIEGAVEEMLAGVWRAIDGKRN